ncbi:FMRFamide receptor [Andrena cerasifolii]|uniref:FMRFamide receptor n=1 Tax=Andrena cerasifolii TaxID=2819439 RepID=UPI004037FCEF
MDNMNNMKQALSEATKRGEQKEAQERKARKDPEMRAELQQGDSQIIFDDISLWIVEPTLHSIIVYSVGIPIVSLLGIVGNALILRVLCDGKFKASVFTYLTVLATADLVTCSMLLFSGLARGVFWCRTGWLEFDVFVHLPVVSVSSNVTVWAAVCVTIDRLVIVFSLHRCKPPKFCDYRVARKLMIFFGCFAILFNVPYCLIYTYNEQGNLVTTEFFHSWLYDLQNWLQFVMFGMIPAVLLLVANVIMCQSVKRTLRQRQLVLQRKNLREGNRLRDQARMTVMLVGIVFVFIVGEVPTHLASRRSALSLLYGGDASKISEHYMETFRMYATLLNTISSSVNFILYCLLSRHFLSHLKRLLTSEPIRRSTTMRSSVPSAMQQTECPRVIKFTLSSHM